MAYPKQLLSADESVITEFRPHWSRILKEIVLSIAALIVLILIATLVDLPAEGWVSVIIAALLLLLVARGIAAWWFTQHVITTERVIHRSGVFSRTGKEIPLEVVNDVAFTQSPFERLIGSGDLLIESAGEHGQSHYRDIPHPEVIQKVIYEAREKRVLHFEGGSRAQAPISKVQQLEILSRLHDEGKLTDDEFEAEKRALGEGTAGVEGQT